MKSNKYSEGQWVIYRKTKSSESPGPRAKNLRATSKGDSYHYFVDKFWIVAGILDEGFVKLRTRTGKTHLVSVEDNSLRTASWWERFAYRNRFREIETSNNAESSARNAE